MSSSVRQKLLVNILSILLLIVILVQSVVQIKFKTLKTKVNVLLKWSVQDHSIM